jgi:hypothetical protein
MVALRIGGLHVHLCLDGSEPPTSLHVADSGMHHVDEPVAASEHADRDVALVSDLVAKKPFGNLDLALLAAFAGLMFFLLARPRELASFPPTRARFRSARAHLRPPLRGPPCYA